MVNLITFKSMKLLYQFDRFQNVIKSSKHSKSALSYLVECIFADRIVDHIHQFTVCDVAYLFNKSLECIKPRGLMVAFGNASGKPDPMDVLALAYY